MQEKIPHSMLRTGNSYFWSRLVVIRELTVAVWQSLFHQIVFLLTPSQKILWFPLHLIQTLNIGNRWWGRHTAVFWQSFCHLGSTVLHIKLQWVHQQGKTVKCAKEKKETFRLLSSKVAPGSADYHTGTHTRSHTHTCTLIVKHAHPIPVVTSEKIRKLYQLLTVPWKK